MTHDHVKTRLSIEGRKEPRLLANFEVHIRKADGSNVGEILCTQNISPRGARLMARVFWKPGELVLLKVLKGKFVVEGRVAYCNRIQDGRYAVGVRVISSGTGWERFPS